MRMSESENASLNRQEDSLKAGFCCISDQSQLSDAVDDYAKDDGPEVV